jgi:hypothetical protein
MTRYAEVTVADSSSVATGHRVRSAVTAPASTTSTAASTSAGRSVSESRSISGSMARPTAINAALTAFPIRSLCRAARAGASARGRTPADVRAAPDPAAVFPA